MCLDRFGRVMLLLFMLLVFFGFWILMLLCVKFVLVWILKFLSVLEMMFSGSEVDSLRLDSLLFLLLNGVVKVLVDSVVG